MLVCAPTGAGKTNIALLTVCHELKKHIEIVNENYYRINSNEFKIIYISPMKALASEIVSKFSEKLQ